MFGADSIADIVTTSTRLLFGYFLLPANLFLYEINDIFDADVNRENPNKGTRETRYRGDTVTR